MYTRSQCSIDKGRYEKAERKLLCIEILTKLQDQAPAILISQKP